MYQTSISHLDCVERTLADVREDFFSVKEITDLVNDRSGFHWSGRLSEREVEIALATLIQGGFVSCELGDNGALYTLSDRFQTKAIASSLSDLDERRQQTADALIYAAKVDERERSGEQDPNVAGTAIPTAGNRFAYLIHAGYTVERIRLAEEPSTG